MALIIYSWGNKLIKKQFMGVKPCPQCGRMTEQYLKRQYFTLGIFYIPIIWVPTKRYYVCEGCGAGVEIDKAKFKEYKEQYRHMPKKSKYLAAYSQLEAIAPTLSDEDRNVDKILGRISETVKFTPEEEPFARDMVKSYLDYAAAIASAKAAADAAAAQAAQTAQAAETADGAAETSANDSAAAVPAAAPAAAAAAASPLVVENPTGSAPARGTQTVYTPQTVAGQPAVSVQQQPVKKKKWGWLVAGIIQTFIMLFGLLVVIACFSDASFRSDPAGLAFITVICGLIPVGLTVLFYCLFAKK